MQTTLLIMGPTRGYQLAVAKNLPAMFIERVGDDFVIRETPRFEQLFGGDI